MILIAAKYAFMILMCTCSIAALEKALRSDVAVHLLLVDVLFVHGYLMSILVSLTISLFHLKLDSQNMSSEFFISLQVLIRFKKLSMQKL